jgi:hypothetical protein
LNGNGNGSGAKPWTFIAEYIYRDEAGAPHLRVQKYLDENGKKQYPQAHFENGSWAKGKPAGAKIPYRLPELVAAPLNATIFLAEGEKCADALAKIEFVSTTVSEGAAAAWDPALTPYFKDRHVVVLPDADTPGRKHGQKVAAALNGVAASVKVVDLFPDRNDSLDVYDWLKDDRAGSRLAKLVKDADEWEAPSETSGDGAGKSDEELIAELAALPKLQYEKRREAAAKQLDIRVSALDKLVAEARGDEEKSKDEVLYPHWAVEPSDEPVDGGALLEALVDTIRRYVVLSDDQSTVVALWIVLTWIHEEVAIHSPILLVTSPQPNSGKTTLLKVVSFMVRRPISSVSITGPALFRSIEKWAPSFILDEGDTAIVNNDDLKEVLNSGWAPRSLNIKPNYSVETRLLPERKSPGRAKARLGRFRFGAVSLRPAKLLSATPFRPRNRSHTHVL